MAAGDGLISMTPTSIAVGSGTASINADGGVDFSAVTSLSLNGVFTGDYDNYLISIAPITASGTVGLRYTWRALGTDATGSDYYEQRIVADGSSATGARNGPSTSTRISTISTGRQGYSFHAYGPYLAQPTAARSVTIDSQSSALIYDIASTHGLSTSYDGITIYPASGTLTGTVHVFGYEE